MSIADTVTLSAPAAMESFPRFDRINLSEARLVPVQAHGGEGMIGFHRLAERENLSGRCNFIDLAVVPPGASIGRHTHAGDEEEFYLVLDGEGTMWREEEEIAVRAGDLIRTPPGGTHQLVNTGSSPIRLFVFELEASG